MCNKWDFSIFDEKWSMSFVRAHSLIFSPTHKVTPQKVHNCYLIKSISNCLLLKCKTYRKKVIIIKKKIGGNKRRKSSSKYSCMFMYLCF